MATDKKSQYQLANDVLDSYVSGNASGYKEAYQQWDNFQQSDNRGYQTLKEHNEKNSTNYAVNYLNAFQIGTANMERQRESRKLQTEMQNAAKVVENARNQKTVAAGAAKVSRLNADRVKAAMVQNNAVDQDVVDDVERKATAANVVNSMVNSTVKTDTSDLVTVTDPETGETQTITDPATESAQLAADVDARNAIRDDDTAINETYTAMSAEADAAHQRMSTAHMMVTMLTPGMERLSEGGNVDLTNRPQVDSKTMKASGWDVEDGSYSTVYTSTYSNENGKRAMNFTPIVVDDDGNVTKVLTPEELEAYANSVLNMGEDYLKLKVGKGYSGENAIARATEAAESIHTQSEQYIGYTNDLADATAEFDSVSTDFEQDYALWKATVGDAQDTVDRFGKALSTGNIDYVEGKLNDIGTTIDVETGYDAVVAMVNDANTYYELYEGYKALNEFLTMCDAENQDAYEMTKLYEYIKENASDEMYNQLTNIMTNMEDTESGAYKVLGTLMYYCSYYSDYSNVLAEMTPDERTEVYNQYASDKVESDARRAEVQEELNEVNAFLSSEVTQTGAANQELVSQNQARKQELEDYINEPLDWWRGNDEDAYNLSKEAESKNYITRADEYARDYKASGESGDLFSKGAEVSGYGKYKLSATTSSDVSDLYEQKLTEYNEMQMTTEPDDPKREALRQELVELKAQMQQEKIDNRDAKSEYWDWQETVWLPTLRAECPAFLSDYVTDNYTVSDVAYDTQRTKTTNTRAYAMALLDNMTEEEANVYNKLLGAGDYDGAQAYFGCLEYQLEQRVASAETMYTIADAEEHPIGTLLGESFYSATAGIVSSIRSFLGNRNASEDFANVSYRESATANASSGVKQGIKNELIKHFNLSDENADTWSSIIVSGTENAVREAITIALTMGVGAVASVGAEMAVGGAEAVAESVEVANIVSNSVKNSIKVSQYLSLMGMSVNAGSSAMYGKIQQGVDVEQAVKYGAAVATMEFVTEKIGMDAFFGKLNGEGGHLADIVANKIGGTTYAGLAAFIKGVLGITSQAAAEASEELISGIADPIWDVIINGNQSDYAQSIRKYVSGYTEVVDPVTGEVHIEFDKDNAMSLVNARKQTILDLTEDALGEAFAGGVTGGIMGGISLPATIVQNNAIGQAILNEGNYMGLINDASNLDESSLAYKIAESLKAKMAEANKEGATYTPTAAEMTQLSEAVLYAEGHNQALLTSEDTMIGDSVNSGHLSNFGGRAYKTGAYKAYGEYKSGVDAVQAANVVMYKIANGIEVTDSELLTMTGRSGEGQQVSSDLADYLQTKLGYRITNGTISDLRTAVKVYEKTKAKSDKRAAAKTRARNRVKSAVPAAKAITKAENANAKAKSAVDQAEVIAREQGAADAKGAAFADAQTAAFASDMTGKNDYYQFSNAFQNEYSNADSATLEAEFRNATSGDGNYIIKSDGNRIVGYRTTGENKGRYELTRDEFAKSFKESNGRDATEEELNQVFEPVDRTPQKSYSVNKKSKRERARKEKKKSQQRDTAKKETAYKFIKNRDFEYINNIYTELTEEDIKRISDMTVEQIREEAKDATGTKRSFMDAIEYAKTKLQEQLRELSDKEVIEEYLKDTDNIGLLIEKFPGIGYDRFQELIKLRDFQIDNALKEARESGNTNEQMFLNLFNSVLNDMSQEELNALNDKMKVRDPYYGLVEGQRYSEEHPNWILEQQVANARLLNPDITFKVDYSGIDGEGQYIPEVLVDKETGKQISPSAVVDKDTVEQISPPTIIMNGQMGAAVRGSNVHARALKSAQQNTAYLIGHEVGHHLQAVDMPTAREFFEKYIVMSGKTKDDVAKGIQQELDKYAEFALTSDAMDISKVDIGMATEEYYSTIIGEMLSNFDVLNRFASNGGEEAKTFLSGLRTMVRRMRSDLVEEDYQNAVADILEANRSMMTQMLNYAIGDDGKVAAGGATIEEATKNGGDGPTDSDIKNAVAEDDTQTTTEIANEKDKKYSILVGPDEVNDKGDNLLKFLNDQITKSTGMSIEELSKLKGAELTAALKKGEYHPVNNPDGQFLVVYHGMQLFNGKLYPSMAKLIAGDEGVPSELWKWEKAYESIKDNIELLEYQYKSQRFANCQHTQIDENGRPYILASTSGKKGARVEVDHEGWFFYFEGKTLELDESGGTNYYFTLKKGDDEFGVPQTPVHARYNPYMHGSNWVLNDQFKSAWYRHLVTLKCIVPMSEADKAYTAKFSKDGTGWNVWKSGAIAGKVAAYRKANSSRYESDDLERKLFLSRYMMPVEIMNTYDVAREYMSYTEEADIPIIEELVPPSLFKALQNLGAKVDANITDGQRINRYVEVHADEASKYLGIAKSKLGGTGTDIVAARERYVMETLGHIPTPEDYTIIDDDVNDPTFNIRYSTNDTKYLKAVEDGDMDTAQRMVDEYANTHGYTRAGFHGTMNGNFTVFDKHYAKPGGNSGAGFYFTTDYQDSVGNYKDVEGADNYFKWSALAEQILDMGEYNGEVVEDYDTAVEIAKKELSADPKVFSVYLRTQNPYVRNYKDSTNLYDQIESSFDESDVVREDYDSDDDYEEAYYIAKSDHISEEIYGAVYQAYRSLENDYAEVFDYGLDLSDVTSKLTESAYDYNSLTWDDIVDAVSGNELSVMNDDWNESADATHEFARAFIQALGYDSIVDKEVSTKFNQLIRTGSNTEHIIVFSPYQIKQSDPVTYDKQGNVIPLSERFDSGNKDIRYSTNDTTQDFNDTFYSNMERVITNMKQDKIGVGNVISYLKNHGVKDEEIQWSFIEDELNNYDGKSVSKQWLLDRIRSNELRLKETVLSDGEGSTASMDYASAVTEFEWYIHSTYGIDASGVIAAVIGHDSFMKSITDDPNYTTQIGDAISNDKHISELETKLANTLKRFREQRNKPIQSNDTLWGNYTSPGLRDYKEIIVQMRNSSYTNGSMTAHWSEDSPGVLVHARVGKMIDSNDNTVYFVDELQSDWHNAGATKGYQVDDDYSRIRADDAPFKNGKYIELMMKRLLRNAVLGGYDTIGWTDADTQSERWSDDYAEGYRIEYDQDIPKFMRKYCKQWGATVRTGTLATNQSYWAVDITDAMRDSLSQVNAQPMFSINTTLSNLGVENTQDITDSYNKISNTIDINSYFNGSKQAIGRLTNRALDTASIIKAANPDIEYTTDEIADMLVEDIIADAMETYAPADPNKYFANMYETIFRKAFREVKHKVPMGSTFSGTGTLEAGVRAIIEMVYANEYDPNLAAGYTSNYGAVVYTDVDTENKSHGYPVVDIGSDNIKSLISNGHIMLVGDVQKVGKNAATLPDTSWFHCSPVCKRFSSANNNAGEQELDRTTALACANIIRTKKPMFVTVENVVQYKGSDALKSITDTLEELGYDWEIVTVRDSDYGGATKRKRMFVRAVREGTLSPMPAYTHTHANWYDLISDQFPDMEEWDIAAGIRERFENSVKKPKYRNRGYSLDPNESAEPFVVYGGTKDSTLREDGSKVYGAYIVPMDDTFPTITASNNDGFLVLPPAYSYDGQGHVLKLRSPQLKIIQGLPADFVLPDSEGDAVTVIGNGISPRITVAVTAGILYDKFLDPVASKEITSAISTKYLDAANNGDTVEATRYFNEYVMAQHDNGVTPVLYVDNTSNAKTRGLVNRVRNGDADAIAEAASDMAAKIPYGSDYVLVPMPSSSGSATNTLELANKIGELSGLEVVDALNGMSRKQTHPQGKSARNRRAEQYGFELKDSIPDGKIPIVIDDVIYKGTTGAAAVRALKGGMVLAYGYSNASKNIRGVKSADAITYDDSGNVIPLEQRFNARDSDSRFSVNKPVEQVGSLMALHNITHDNLNRLLELDAIPSPSIAVTNQEGLHNGYGDISLVFRKETVDPESDYANTVWDRDAYTPTFTNTKVFDLDYDVLRDYLYGLAEQNDASDVDIESASDYLYGLYTEYGENGVYYDFDVGKISDDIKRGDDTALELAKIAGVNSDSDGQSSYDTGYRVIRLPFADAVERFYSDRFEPGEWRSPNEKSPLTRDRSSDEIVSDMYEGYEGDWQPSPWMGNIEARPLNSIDDMHRLEGKLSGYGKWESSDGNANFALHEIRESIYDAVTDIAKNKGIDLSEYDWKTRVRLAAERVFYDLYEDNFVIDNGYEDRSIMTSEYVFSKIADAVDDEFSRILGTSDINLSEADDEMMSVIELMGWIQVAIDGKGFDYFEAKPQRSVQWDEVAYAVVPEKTPIEIIDKLNDKNIPHYTYKAYDNQNRADVINAHTKEHSGTLFSVNRLTSVSKEDSYAREDEIRKEIARENASYSVNDAPADVQESYNAIVNAILARNSKSEHKISRGVNTTYESMHVFDAAETEADRLAKQNLKEKIGGYDSVTEKQSVSEAKNRLETQGYLHWKSTLETKEAWTSTDYDTAMGIAAQLQIEARRSGNTDAYHKWLTLMTTRMRESARLVQAAAKYNRSSVGSQIQAIKLLNELHENGDMKDQDYNHMVNEITDVTNLISACEDGDNEDLIDLIIRTARLRGMKPGKSVVRNLRNQDFEYLSTFANTIVMNAVDDYSRRSFAKKAGTFQYLAQLLNLRTCLRNITSNGAFGVVETGSREVGALIDTLVGAATGQRSVGALKRGRANDVWDDGGKKGTFKGAREESARAYLEARLDVGIADRSNKYINSSSRTFKVNKRGIAHALERGLSHLEMINGYSLNVTDEFFKGAIYQGMLNSYTNLVEKGLISREQAELFAQQEMLYATFQDDTAIGSALQGIKSGLNHIGTKDFGLGDFVCKYTRVPGALIHRAIEYSPAGALKSIYNLGKLVKSKGTDIQAQQNFSLGMARCMTGTMLIAAATWLVKNGLVKRDEDEDDKDVAALNRSEGIGSTQINLDAIGRFLDGESTEWRYGDDLWDIGFMDPLSSTLTMGALIASAIDRDGEQSFMQWAEANIGMTAAAFSDLSMMSTINDVLYAMMYHDENSDLSVLGDSAITFASSSVTSMLPSLGRQFAQGMDKNYRNAYGGSVADDKLNEYFDEDTADALGVMVNNILTALPGTRTLVPEKLDNFGNEKTYSESLKQNMLNAMVNPSKYATYTKSDASEVMSQVYEANQELDPKFTPGFYPDRNAPKTLSNNGEVYQLTDEQRSAYQIAAGDLQEELIGQVSEEDAFINADAQTQADILKEVKSYSNYKAKQSMLETMDSEYTNTSLDKYDSAADLGIGFAEYYNISQATQTSVLTEQDSDGNTIKYSYEDNLLDYLDDSGYTDKQKVGLYGIIRGSDGDSTATKIQDLMDQGMTFREVSTVKQKYNALDRMEDAEFEAEYNVKKIDVYNHYLRSEMNLSEDEVNAVDDKFRFRMTMSEKETSSIDKMESLGMDGDTAFKIGNLIGGLEPEDGKDDVSNDQKYQAILNSDLTGAEKTKAIGAVAGSKSVAYNVSESDRDKLYRVAERIGDTSVLTSEVPTATKVNGVSHEYTAEEQSTYTSTYVNTLDAFSSAVTASTYTNTKGNQSSMADRMSDLAGQYSKYMAIKSNYGYDEIMANDDLKAGYKVYSCQTQYGVTPAQYLEYWVNVQSIMANTGDGESSKVKAYLATKCSSNDMLLYLYRCIYKWTATKLPK